MKQMNDNNKTRENRIILLLSLAAVIAACVPLFTKLCINGHDLEYHLLRIESLKEQILAGRPFLKVNMLFFGGAGYASSMFYPDLLLYIPAALRALGVSINTSYHVFAGLCILLCYLSAFYCGREITGSKAAGALCAILLTLCDYHIEDIYVRSAVGEYTAFIFIPFVICGIHDTLYREMKKPWLLGVGFGGLLLSHTGSFIMCLGLCIVIFLIKLKVFVKKPRIIAKLLLTALLTAGATSFYWLPMLEQLMCAGFAVSIPWMRPVDETRSFAQLFYSEFPSIGAGLITVYVLRVFVDKEENPLSGFSDILYVTGGVFMLGATGLFPWERLGRYMGFIQFPWRSFIIASSLFAFADGILIFCLFKERGAAKEKTTEEAVGSDKGTDAKASGSGRLAAAEARKDRVIYATAGVFLLCALQAFSVMEKNDQGYYDYSDDYYSYAPYTANVIAGEWLPLTVTDRDALTEQSSRATGDEGQEVAFERYKNELTFTAERDLEYVDVPFIYYRGYGAFLEGKKLDVDGEGVNGLTRVYTDHEEGRVRVSYEGTPCQRYSLMISAIALIVALTLMIRANKKGRASVYALCLLVCVPLSGCARADGEEAYDDGLTRAQRLDEITKTISEYNEERNGGAAGEKGPEKETDETEYTVCVPAGFEPGSNKHFYVIINDPDDAAIETMSFTLKDEGTGEAVYSGELTEVNAERETTENAGSKDASSADRSKDGSEDGGETVKVLRGDLTPFTKEGTYLISCSFGEGITGDSEIFSIETNYYQNLLTMELLSDGASGSAGPEQEASDEKERTAGFGSNVGDKRDTLMFITDMLVSYEFFDKELIEAWDKNLVPRSLELGGAYIDSLRELENEDGGISEGDAPDICEDYLYGAVLAKYASDIIDYDKKRAEELTKAARRAFDKAEKLYDKKEEETDELCGARFWAAAELYKLTGKKGYREAAEGCVREEIPKGFSKGCWGDLGSIAYLTTRGKTDRELSQRLMDSLIERAIEITKTGVLNKTEIVTDKPEKAMEEVLGRARLLIFSNLVGQSTDYIRASEEAAGWLCGMNGARQNLLITESGRAAVCFILNGLAGSYVAGNM